MTAPAPPAPGDGDPISPIITVGSPRMIVPPWAHVSPKRAAGKKLMNTPVDPLAMMSGGPTQVAMFVTVAAGRNPISTVGTPGGRMGPPT